jgi:hypothetical protein
MKFTFPPEARPLDGYTIKRAIHRGGFGEVYYALSDAGKEVALKLLNNNLEVELRGVSQCLNLKHPNLVTIFDIKQDSDSDHWVIMEFVSGRGLYETLQDYPNGMPVEEILAWLTGICAGLNFLHDRGIVHRDLKPANVFRDHGGVKIGDVGLSKYISESHRSAQTQSVGTVYYMAPEVARGRYGREVDVYALGIMLYEMLTGNVPFEGQTTAEILMKHLTAEPDLSVLPPNLQPLIAATLKKDPDQRISNIEDVEQRFRAAVVGVDIKAPVPLTAGKESLQSQAGIDTADASFEQARRHADTVIDVETPIPADQTSGFTAVVGIWNSLPVPLQWVIGGATALLILESGLLRPVAVGGMFGGVAYLGYQIVNAVVGENETKVRQRRKNTQSAGLHPEPKPEFVTAVADTVVPPPQPSFRQQLSGKRGRRVVVYTPATLRRISKRQRAADISTSVSVSLAAAALVTLAVYLTTNLLHDVPQAVFFATVTMLASWGLIIPSKLWEGRPGDNFTRRLALGGIGLGIGFIAATMAQYLLIDTDSLFKGPTVGKPYMLGRVTISDGSGYPTLACYMIFFGALFAVRRWWWQIDSFRKSRFRVTSALFTLVVGVVITGMLQEYSFPDALGATWALAISAVVQLSAGWTPSENRLLATEMPSDRNVPHSADKHSLHVASSQPSAANQV